MESQGTSQSPLLPRIRPSPTSQGKATTEDSGDDVWPQGIEKKEFNVQPTVLSIRSEPEVTNITPSPPHCQVRETEKRKILLAMVYDDVEDNNDNNDDDVSFR